MPSVGNETTHASDLLADSFNFPPVTRDHILHCSYDYWFPKYRTSCIRSKIVPLSAEFVSYLREDGIILADDDDEYGGANRDDTDDDDWEPSGPSSEICPPPNMPHPHPGEAGEESDDDEGDAAPPRIPPDRRFPAQHQAIKDAIHGLGGAVAPKLNWSSPKDAVWISRHANTVKCTTPNDVYMLLKSSSFASHDLEHAFDDTVAPTAVPFQPVLALRAFFSPVPSLEFRCFVKDRTLVAITARDLNYYAFLGNLRGAIVARALELFRARLRLTFPEPCFVFDVYLPEADWDHDGDNDNDNDNDESRLGRARLIDINPWAPRTDTLLFDWQELLDLRVPRPLIGSAGRQDAGFAADGEPTTDDDVPSDGDDEEYEPELRIVERDDPAAYNFSSPQYSAHKLPKDVVDAASLVGEGGMRELVRTWQDMTGTRDLWEEAEAGNT